MKTKQIYLAPEFEVVEIETETSIMQASLGVSDTTVDGNEEIRSKRRNFWGNEE